MYVVMLIAIVGVTCFTLCQLIRAIREAPHNDKVKHQIDETVRELLKVGKL